MYQIIYTNLTDRAEGEWRRLCSAQAKAKADPTMVGAVRHWERAYNRTSRAMRFLRTEKGCR